MSYRTILAMASTLAAILVAAALAVACSGATEPPPAAPTTQRAVAHPIAIPAVVSPTPVKEPPQESDPGRRLGRYQLTYYWVADEAALGGRASVTLRDRKCKPIAKVSAKFRRALMLEGTGKLKDGRIVNVSGGCRCSKRCFLVASEDSPYGYGVASRSLRPFRSIAAPRHIKVGTVLYVPELDGLTVPGSSPLGGTVHNGCVVADDRGGNVEGRQLDLFTGKRTVYRSFFRRHKIARITVHRAGDRCKDLDAEGVSRRGDG